MRRFLILAALTAPLVTSLAQAQRPASYPPGGYRPTGPHGGGGAGVAEWYRRFLPRGYGPEGGRCAGRLDSGERPESVLAIILGSDEYYKRFGGSPRGFVASLIRDLTGQPPAPRELEFWAQRLYQGEDRTQPAYELLLRYPQGWGPPEPPVPDYYNYRRPYYRY